MQTPIFLTKLSDESIIFIIDVGKKITLQNYCITQLYLTQCYSQHLCKINLFMLCLRVGILITLSQ
jgi:hypothetical protein